MPIVSKGTVLQMDVAASLTAISEVFSLEVSGAKSGTFDYTVFGQSGSGEARLATGYSTPPTIAAEYFVTPTNAGQQALTDEILAPTVVAANQLDGKIIYADTGATELAFKIAGIEVGQKFATNDGVKGSVTFELNGQPVWPT